MSLLHVKDVAIERGDRSLLRGISLSVEAGELWQLIGPNGVINMKYVYIPLFNTI